jgi:hypothetical protein
VESHPVGAVGARAGDSQGLRRARQLTWRLRSGT